MGVEMFEQEFKSFEVGEQSRFLATNTRSPKYHTYLAVNEKNTIVDLWLRTHALEASSSFAKSHYIIRG